MRILSTIRARLWVGFGITVALILTAGMLAGVALQRAGQRSAALLGSVRFEQESVQQVAYRLLQEVAAGMRYLNSGTAADGARYTALADEADRLRRAAVKLDALSSAERQKLEELGTLQGTVEVGIGVAHAYRAIGKPAEAAAICERAMSSAKHSAPRNTRRSRPRSTRHASVCAVCSPRCAANRTTSPRRRPSWRRRQLARRIAHSMWPPR